MEFNAADIFEGVVDRIPDREAVVLGSTRLTYQELDARSNKAANALKKLGIKKGSHIGIYAFNCIEWLEVMLGAYKLCAIPININYRYVEEELKYLIDNADMEAVFYHKQFGEKLNNIKNDLPILKDFICINDDSDADDVIEGSYDFEALISNEDNSRISVERSGDDKYITLYRRHHWNAKGCGMAYGGCLNDTWRRYRRGNGRKISYTRGLCR